MTDAAPEASDFNTKIIDEFRANEGRIGGPLAGTPMILVHHIGAKSGTVRVTPLACNPQPDGRLAIVASNGGSPAHPGWYYNLREHPDVLFGGMPFRAEIVEDEAERRRLWELADRVFPQYAVYREWAGKAGRVVPIVQLVPHHN